MHFLDLITCKSHFFFVSLQAKQIYVIRTTQPIYSMRQLTILLFACLAMVSCTHSTKQSAQTDQSESRAAATVSQGEALLNILNAENRSLLVLNNDSLSYYSGRGVQDLLQLIREEPERLNGAIVADKMIGKAAAVLMVAGGVKEVHTNLICTPAKEVFSKAGVPVYATEEVEQILNRDRTGQCPIDALLNESDQVEECVRILQARFGE